MQDQHSNFIPASVVFPASCLVGNMLSEAPSLTPQHNVLAILRDERLIKTSVLILDTQCICYLLREGYVRGYAPKSVLSLRHHTGQLMLTLRSRHSQWCLYKGLLLSGRNFLTSLPVYSTMALQLVLSHLNKSLILFKFKSWSFPLTRFLSCTCFPQSQHIRSISLFFIKTLLNCFLSYHILSACSSLPLRSLVQVLTV